jgi:hypothetical protein
MHFLKRACIAGLLLICAASPLFADLEDFREDVIAAEQEAEEEGPEEEEADTRTEEQKQLDAELFAAILRIWFLVNVAVDYDAYPYADGPYIGYRDKDPSTGPGKFYRFAIGGEAFYAPGTGSGFHASFEGKAFPLIGPRFEVTSLFDGTEQLHLVSLGAAFSLLQTNLLSGDLYVQWTSMQGVLTRTGTAFGLLLTSYPFKPVSLRARIGTRNYSSGVEFEDWSFALGLHVRRWEFYGGWRALQTDDLALAGPFIGAAAHY